LQWALFARLDREVIARQVAPRITPELIEEHRRVPFGPHSADLALVVNVLRRNCGDLDGKLVVVDRGNGYALARLVGRRGEAVGDDGHERYESRSDAEHAVFLARLVDLGLMGDHTSQPGATEGRAMP
jgi:hypothetical protein